MKRETHNEVFDRILGRRAARLGLSSEEVLRNADRKPRFLASAEEQARLEGITAEEVLERDIQSMRDSGYPGPDCLQADDVERFVETGELSDHLTRHAEDCVPCRSLLAIAQPDPERVQRFALALPGLIRLAHSGEFQGQ